MEGLLNVIRRKVRWKRLLVFVSFPWWWICDFSGAICGDECTGYDYGQCQCGNETFDRKQNSYCCIPKDSTCIKKGENVNCPDGQKLSWGQKCDVQDDCPVNAGWIVSAISSNCSAPDNVHCPQGRWFSKVCQVDFSNDHAGKNATNSSKFANQYCYSGKPCKLSHGPFYHQCYFNE